MRRRSSASATSARRRSRSVSAVAETIGTRSAERLLGPADGVVVQEGDDRLAERHALDREQAVPARVELVDDDVGVAVALECLVVVEALDDLEVGVEPLAGGDHVLGALAPPRRRRVDDHAAARGRDGGAGAIADEVDPGRDHLGLGHPADGVVGADDLRARPSSRRRARPASCRGCRSPGSGRPTSCGARAGSGTAATAARASGRSRSGRCRSAAAAGAARATASPGGAGSRRGGRATSRPRGGACSARRRRAARRRRGAERLHVRPRDARGVDGAVDDPQRAVGGARQASHSTWSK